MSSRPGRLRVLLDRSSDVRDEGGGLTVFEHLQGPEGFPGPPSRVGVFRPSDVHCLLSQYDLCLGPYRLKRLTVCLVYVYGRIV